MIYWIVGAVLFLLLGGLAAMLIKTVPIARRVYAHQLVRTEKEKWGHCCSAPEHPEQIAMWNAGIAWGEAYKDRIREHWVENDGLKLYGQYFDFGGDRCVIILPGRCECHKYSYYYAEPYRALGMNVLTVDPRAHGISDGKYSTIGLQESKDVLKWVELLKTTYGQKQIWLHSICVGSSTALLLLDRKDCPAEMAGIVMEGCYMSFRECFKRHMVVDKRPLFPVLDLVMLEIYRHTGTNVYLKSPKRCLKRLQKPVLFLCGKEDIFSLPARSQRLYDNCSSRKKKLVWFQHGSHSHLRLNNTAQYDKSIAEFIENV